MAKLPREIIDALIDILSDRPPPPGKYSAQVARAAAANNRALMVIYALLAAGDAFLLFQVEVSPWAGAALVGACVLFIAGLIVASVRMSAYHKALLIADAIERGREFLDIETKREKATAESLFHEAALARQLHSSESHFLPLGLVCVGAALIIDRWQFAWRGFVILAGAVVLFLLVAFVVGLVRSARRRQACGQDSAPSGPRGAGTNQGTRRRKRGGSSSEGQ